VIVAERIKMLMLMLMLSFSWHGEFASRADFSE
jgi:hypothetical protein